MNTPKDIRKKFDNWISRNFKGLSAYTLVQTLKLEMMLPEDYISNMVYVDLFNFFIGRDKSDNAQNTFDACKDWIACIEWL